MTVSTENAASQTSTKSKNSNFSVRIQIKPKSRCEFEPPNDEEFECLDLVDYQNVACSLESVIVSEIWFPRRAIASF